MNSPAGEFSTTSTPAPPVAAARPSTKASDRRVVHVLDAERAQVLALVRVAHRRVDLGAEPPRDLDRHQARPAAAAWISALAALDAGQRLERVPGGEEHDRQARRARNRNRGPA